MISWAIAKCNDLSPTHDRIIWRRMSDVETIQVSGNFMETRCIPAHGPTHIQKGNGEGAVCSVSRNNNGEESIHKASFYGLSPGRYEYSISTRWRDNLQVHTPWCDFEVHPEHPTMMPLDIAVIADVQSGARIFRQAIDILVKEKKKLPDTLIHLGDAVQSARIQRELHAYFWGPIEARLCERVPLIFAEHDLGSDIMREHLPDPSACHLQGWARASSLTVMILGSPARFYQPCAARTIPQRLFQDSPCSHCAIHRILGALDLGTRGKELGALRPQVWVPL